MYFLGTLAPRSNVFCKEWTRGHSIPLEDLVGLVSACSCVGVFLFMVFNLVCVWSIVVYGMRL